MIIKNVLGVIDWVQSVYEDENEKSIRIAGKELEAVKEALKKQIPKKAVRYESCPEDIVLCPTCGSTYVMRNAILMNFCSNCGQALEKDREVIE